MKLPRYQVYTSFHSGGRNTGWMLGHTLPMPPALRMAAELRGRSMAHYGKPFEETEAEYLKILESDAPHHEAAAEPSIGRRKKT